MPFSPVSPVIFFPTEKNMSRFHPGVVAGVKFLPCQPLAHDALQAILIIFYHRYGNMVAHFMKQYQARSLCTEAKCRPCCPANLFLGSAFGTPSPPPPDAPACVLRLTGHGLRCLQRFYDQNSLSTTLFDSEAAFCRLSGESLDPPYFG